MPKRSTGPWYRADRDKWCVWVKGKQVSLGVSGTHNREEAIAAWHRTLGGTVPPPPPPPTVVPPPVAAPEPQLPRHTVDELLVMFLADAKARLKPYTVSQYGHELKGFARVFGSRLAATLTPTELRDWLWGLPVCNTTKDIRGRTVSAFLGWAVRTDLLPANPMKKVKRPRSAARGETSLITEADHKKLLAAASAEFALVLRVLHATGCRPGELRGITVESLHAEQNLALLRVHKADRTGHPRVIVFPPDVTAALVTQAERWFTGPLLRSRGGTPWTAPNVTHVMCRLRKATGVKATAYGYRHTFATDALAAGVPDAHVASLLGHTSTAMLHKHYSHLTSHATVLHEAVALVRPESKPKRKAG